MLKFKLYIYIYLYNNVINLNYIRIIYIPKKIYTCKYTRIYTVNNK